MALLLRAGPPLIGCNGELSLPMSGSLIVAWRSTCVVIHLPLCKTWLSMLCAGGGGDALKRDIQVLHKGRGGMERIFSLWQGYAIL